jgi:hypothetical protein
VPSAADALDLDAFAVGWQKTASEYRKELKRQSERVRLAPQKSRWWESKSSDFHYNYHKNKYFLERAEHHAEMQDKYLDKITSDCDEFWLK